ncbi:MAG: MBL fold metallo-hydrolase [Planctomycetes bacterium]|nr:MBL fold metallo-hydrolase [Planctomycetota bacterium]
MADPHRRRPENVAGDVFVDETCIDCDTCRWMAPETFDRAGEMSRVHHQPDEGEARLRAGMAVLSCPTASIGTTGGLDLRAAAASLPHPVDAQVLHCGYHHEASFGAASWLLLRDDGNVLVDSPRFARPLVERLEALGGVSLMLLTHQDDVADHAKFARHFGCERVLHADDTGPATRDVEHVLRGDEPTSLAHDLLAVPVPGHTRGSVCFLHDGTHLFTGDHLAYSARLRHLYAFRTACWYDWDAQIRSMERLGEYDFEWVLPGHGWKTHLAPGTSRPEIARCVAWMKDA